MLMQLMESAWWLSEVWSLFSLSLVLLMTEAGFQRLTIEVTEMVSYPWVVGSGILVTALYFLPWLSVLTEDALALP